MQFLKHFIKYQSLGNDFIVFDWFKKPTSFIHEELKDAQWQQFVTKICDRHFGIGADGVLIVTYSSSDKVPEILIFNADGSNGQICLNGLRCIAKHLFDHHNFPVSFTIKMGSRIIECSVQSKDGVTTITTNVGCVDYFGPCTIQTTVGQFDGYKASVGNPHFVIFDAKSVQWLAQYGALIESHAAFQQKTNVEFVVPESSKKYSVTVYERGAGVTLACSSGAAAIMGVLDHLKQCKRGEIITLKMPGGALLCSVEQNGTVTLTASAEYVFQGTM